MKKQELRAVGYTWSVFFLSTNQLWKYSTYFINYLE